MTEIIYNRSTVCESIISLYYCICIVSLLFICKFARIKKEILFYAIIILLINNHLYNP